MSDVYSIYFISLDQSVFKIDLLDASFAFEWIIIYLTVHIVVRKSETGLKIAKSVGPL